MVLNNRIIRVPQEELNHYLETLIKHDYIIVGLDGEKIKTIDDFLSSIEESLSFPRPCEGVLARFDDWITDLSWIGREKGICIYIKSFSSFISKAEDEWFKKYILDDFESNILPFWESEVVHIVKDGFTRRFVVIVCE